MNKIDVVEAIVVEPIELQFQRRLETCTDRVKVKTSMVSMRTASWLQCYLLVPPWNCQAGLWSLIALVWYVREWIKYKYKKAHSEDVERDT